LAAEKVSRTLGKTYSAGKTGRRKKDKQIRKLIREMSMANPLWGSPRIKGELAKIGIEVAKSTVEKYMVKKRKPPSQTWKTFLTNHIKDLVSIDFFVVPTIKYKILFVLVVLKHSRRSVVHFNVTEHPTAQWTAQQMIEAFPWEETPRYLIHDQDKIYGKQFKIRVRNMDIKEVVTAPGSPWQNAYAERVIGSIRRECLDHVIVLNEKHLKRILKTYFSYYHQWRPHYSLDMDSPDYRPVYPSYIGKVTAVPEVGGLHHHYERLAA